MSGATGGAAAAFPTVRMAIAHVASGCHVWVLGKQLGPTARIKVARGTHLLIRPNCPMDFDFAQVAGPRLALGNPRTFTGTVRTIVFKKAGVYRLRVHNVQSSEEKGLQTLGPDNELTLTIVVK